MKVKAIRPYYYSKIAGATIYDFKIRRRCIENYPSWHIKAFLNIEDTQIVKLLLFQRDFLLDQTVSSKSIEEFRWGHYVEESFISKVKKILDKILYTESIDDLIILLLTYKYYYSWTRTLIRPYQEMSVLKFLGFIKSCSLKTVNKLTMKIYSPSDFQDFDSSTFTFIRYITLRYISSHEGKIFLESIRDIDQEREAGIFYGKSLQGEDRGRTAELNRKAVVRILYLSLIRFGRTKKERLATIGELISLIDGFKEGFDPEIYDGLSDFYERRLRHLVRGLQPDVIGKALD